MRKRYPLSDQEEEAIWRLGGIDRAVAIADKVLAQHGVRGVLFSRSELDMIRRREKRALEFRFDFGKSLRANIEDLLEQAGELQADAGGTNYVGAMLQHLVGAKLDIVLGEGKLHHHGSSVADHSTERSGDFHIETSAIHVTTHPSEALVRKCAENLKAGLKPLIITLAEAVEPAEFLLKGADIADRVDVLDAAQFLTANVYERSFFKAAECKVTLTALLQRYNAIVATCETDPSLLIKLAS